MEGIILYVSVVVIVRKSRIVSGVQGGRKKGPLSISLHNFVSSMWRKRVLYGDLFSSVFSVCWNFASFYFAYSCSISSLLEVEIRSVSLGFNLDCTVVTPPIRLFPTTAVMILCAYL